MSDQRISVADVRARTHLAPGQSGDWMAAVPRSDLLALVEAVEAAHAVMARPHFHWENPETLALLDALARFEFEVAA